MDSVHRLKEIRFSNFLVAGFASVGATVVTNPIEVRTITILIESYVIFKYYQLRLSKPDFNCKVNLPKEELTLKNTEVQFMDLFKLLSTTVSGDYKRDCQQLSDFSLL